MNIVGVHKLQVSAHKTEVGVQKLQIIELNLNRWTKHQVGARKL